MLARQFIVTVHYQRLNEILGHESVLQADLVNGVLRHFPQTLGISHAVVDISQHR